ncbi:MAG: delta-60 repeat domain-containing protein [Verrucomicrobiales bacterium]
MAAHTNGFRGPHDILQQPDGKILVAGAFSIRSGGTDLNVGVIRLPLPLKAHSRR